MASLAREESSGCSNPILDVFTQVNGRIVDVYEIAYQIFDVSDAAKRATPVQVFPLTPGERQIVNQAMCGDGGSKIETGHYVASWTPSSSESLGTHRIRWTFKLTSVSPETQYEEEFEVIPAVSGYSSSGYCLISDLREEGITADMASDDRLAAKIEEVSAWIEEVTGRFYEPRPLSITVDGHGGKRLMLDMPIVGVSSIYVDDELIDPSLYVVYNRHLSQRMTRPDDRDDPAIQLKKESDLFGFGIPTFKEGFQNIRIEGVFGYTEPDGSPSGRTPRLIRALTKHLVVRWYPKLGDDEERFDVINRWRVAEEKTRDQSVRFAVPRPRGGDLVFTGDTEIDALIALYIRPISLGST